MKNTHSHIVLIVIYSCIVYCTCASFRPASFASKQSSFGRSSLSPGNFQSWQEWAKKRNFGSGSNSFGQSLTPHNFQSWSEFMNKRGFHIPNNKFGQSQYQTWSEWAKKRGFGYKDHSAGNPFSADLKNNNFQSWDDWKMKKRGLSSPFGSHNSAMFGSDAAGLQSWNEFIKRQGLPFHQSSPGFGRNTMGGLQSWHEWAKRGNFGTNQFDVMGDEIKNKDWSTKSEQNLEKRQLGPSPRGFGDFNGYFTSGLQDWRSTFRGSKRGGSKMEDSDKDNTPSTDTDTHPQ